MTNPMQMWNSWFALSSQAIELTWEAQTVMALRFVRLAQGGSIALSEAQRMVAEKVAAMAEAQGAVASATIMGRSSRRVGKKVLGVYRKRVRANRRRLSK